LLPSYKSITFCLPLTGGLKGQLLKFPRIFKENLLFCNLPEVYIREELPPHNTKFVLQDELDEVISF